MSEEEQPKPDQSPESPKPPEPDPWPEFAVEEIHPGLRMLQISDDVWGTHYGAHIYVVGDAREVVLIDSAFEKGPPYSFLNGFLSAIGKPKVRAILLTHNHKDHSGGAAKIRGRYDTPILCHPLERPLVIESTKVEAKDDQPEIPGTLVDGDIVDGQEFEIGGQLLRAVFTPGHSPGHFCFYMPRHQTMLTGDLVLGSATTSVSPPHGDMILLLKSLERLLDFPMQRIAPAHGDIIDDPVENVRGVLEHRRQREEQVLKALSDGYVTPKDIVTSIYVDLREKLVELAGKQVTSMLLKLEREGRVASEGEGDDRIWRRS